jgi:predicted ester cyclase
VSKGTRHKTRRRASAESDVVITTLPSGEREFVVDPKAAAELSPTIEAQVVEFKAAPTPAPIVESQVPPVWSCGICKRPAGKSADGSVVLLFPSNGQTICTDCAAIEHAKALANGDVKDGVVPDMKSNVTSDAELIAAFMEYHDVSSQIIEKLVAERDETSSVSTNDVKMSGYLSDIAVRGRKRKPRVTVNLSPSQQAAAHEVGRNRRGIGVAFSASKKTVDDMTGPAPFAYDAKGHAIPLCESCHGVGCLECLQAGYVDPVDAMVRRKLAKIEARKATEWQIEFDASGFNFYRPQTKGVGFQDASVPDFESAVRAIEYAHRAAHSSPSVRKFRSS